jgi:hypothetical protein
VKECRYYPREAPKEQYPQRRPHLNAPWQNVNIMCLCDACDAKVEAKHVEGKFLSELCDCDVYKRWICHRCKVEEQKMCSAHYENHTLTEGSLEKGYPPTKVMVDHQHDLYVSCTNYHLKTQSQKHPILTSSDLVLLSLRRQCPRGRAS